MTMTRRGVLSAAGVAAAGLAAAPAIGAKPAGGKPFSLNYAPNSDSFKSRGATVLDQIAYAADQGFRAWEDNTARDRSANEQEAMARLMAQRGMTMGVFVASMPRWSQQRPLLGGNDAGDREAFLADIGGAVEVAKRLNAKWMTVVTGFLDQRVPHDIQTARVIETMRRAADIMEPHGLVMVMEPLNTRTDHPGIFMQTTAQCYAMAKAVRSPALKVLADVYHEQIQSGNLIPTLEATWDEVAYVQFGDTPGRKEPGTGEINYRNIVRWLRARRYAGVIGMEHGNSVDGAAGENRLIAAYREIDAA